MEENPTVVPLEDDPVSQSKRPKMSEHVTNNCKFFVHRKKRFCKMTVKEGEEYCGEHKKISTDFVPSNEASKDSAVRIACPLDGNHTCYAHNLKKHLKICNARPKPLEPFISKGINTDQSAAEEDNTYRLLSSFPTEDIRKTITKVNDTFTNVIQKNLSQKISTNKFLEQEMQKPDYGFKTKKHLEQVSSILGLLGDYNLMKRNTCYIEFGAGRGQLSFWLASTIDDEDSKILLIERASPKHKKDNKLAKTTDKVSRIRADISDIVLDKLEQVLKSSSVVGVTKHLCGEATDLAIRCLGNVQDNRDKVNGCILTFCCHHRCRWVPYTGKEFFKQQGLSKQDFDIMCGMASWATCGTGLSREMNKEVKESEMKQNERDAQIGLSRLEKEEVGRRSKNVLNWGRLHFLEQCGFKCYLHYYVDKDITLENVCIVAVKQQL
ncbi:unnamed protein product [Phyllotreta striolata]|uniref:tRNA:m(4)X modification enzyme TRM13 n=1 Tax=Phyllotreta striolata TaxID=444603 RepID=A0A9N9TKK7_PHYSR|nr:unnamed protein product [Phyllotreta striolata]